MKLNLTLAISDIHGELKKFEKILSHWNPNEMNLVIIGDLIDRGENSLEVIQKVISLKEEFPDQVIVTMGNHEDMLLQFLNNPDYETGDWYFNNGGSRTCASFCPTDEFIFFKSFEERAKSMFKREKEIQFLKELPFYYEFGEVIFVHAGINTLLDDWKLSSENHMLWSRDMWYHKNETGKKIVFGHTPTRMLHPDGIDDVWISSCETYIAIDGGMAYKGQANGLLISKEGEILNIFIEK
ncbi:metallophosphoesterase family protein [Bacillus stercoris]|nr:metallophosphoesterase family protein [Bacillus stercoris]